MERELENTTSEAVDSSLSQLSGDVLTLLKLARDATGWPLDFWSDLTEGMDPHSIALLVMRAESLRNRVHSHDLRDAQLGWFIRSICTHGGLQNCPIGSAEAKNAKLQQMMEAASTVSIGKELSLEKAHAAFEKIYPQSEEDRDLAQTLNKWYALDPASKQLVSRMIDSLAISQRGAADQDDQQD